MVTSTNLQSLRVIQYRMNLSTDLKKWTTEKEFTEKSDTGKNTISQKIEKCSGYFGIWKNCV